jgi:hypothetical protein
MKKPFKRSIRARKRHVQGGHGATAPKPSLIPSASIATVRSGAGSRQPTAGNRGHGPGFEPTDDTSLQLPSGGSEVEDAVSEKKPHAPKVENNQFKKLNVYLAAADDGSQVTVVRYRRKSLVLTIDKLYDNRKEIYKRIHEMGVPMLKKEAKEGFQQLLDVARKGDNMIVATKGGYDRRNNPRKGPQYFAYPDGKILTRRSAPKVYSTLTPNRSFSSAGTFSDYEAGVSSVLKDQAAPLLIFFIGLSPILQRFTKEAGYFVENVILEMIGPTSTYKSTFTNLIAGSIWGGDPSSKLGYARSWNATANKIEEFCKEYNNSLLVLDEATLAGTTPSERGAAILNVLHRLSSGETKGRMGQQDMQRFELIALSNSNEPLLSLIKESSNVEAAGEVRLIAIECPTRKTGYFDSIPHGHNSVEAAMKGLRKVCNENHGILAKRMIKAVLKWSERDHDELIRAIGDNMLSFLMRCGISPEFADQKVLRRAKPFALAYATAEVAFKAGVLNKELWGNVRRTLVRAWKMYGRRGGAPDGNETIAAFLANPQAVIIDVSNGEKPEVSDDEFNRLDGFIYIDRGKTVYLAMTRRSMTKNLAMSKAALKKMKKRGYLKGSSNLQSKARLRKVKGVEKYEKLYLFVLAHRPENAVSIEAWRSSQK